MQDQGQYLCYAAEEMQQLTKLVPITLVYCYLFEAQIEGYDEFVEDRQKASLKKASKLIDFEVNG